MEQIIQNPGFQHVAEKIFLNLPFEDLLTCQLVNMSTNHIVQNPMFWIKKWILKGLTKKNQDDWIKAIQLTNVILYMKKVLHNKGSFLDGPCYICEKTVEKLSKPEIRQIPVKNFHNSSFSKLSHQKYRAHVLKLDYDYPKKQVKLFSHWHPLGTYSTTQPQGHMGRILLGGQGGWS